jgi:hypothetical protein
MDMKKPQINKSESVKLTWQNINRGKPIYYKGVKHYIVYEFDDKMLIAKEEDLIKAFCVNKVNLSVKPKQ